MDQLREIVGNMCKVGLALGVGGTVLATSCSTSEVNAVLAGVEFVADQLSNDGSDSFGHWLSDALDD